MYQPRTKEEIAAANRHHSYMKGWRAGACANAKDRLFAEHALYAADYEKGYEDGTAARGVAAETATFRTGHRSSILR